MKPVAITFADSKFTLLAQRQKENFNEFGLKHVIVPIEEQTYGIELWIKLLDLTVEAIVEHGKIFRVDSEIRLLQDLKYDWHDANVLFHIDHPRNIINTGHMILDRSAIPFLQKLRKLTISLIPENYAGEKLPFDDEDATMEAIEATKLEHISEIIDYVRRDTSDAACTRGSWSTDETIFTHPFIHNWDVAEHNISARDLFRNHFRPWVSVGLVDAVIMGIERKNLSESFWKKLSFVPIGGDQFQLDEWIILPAESAFRNTRYKSTKFIQPFQP